MDKTAWREFRSSVSSSNTMEHSKIGNVVRACLLWLQHAHPQTGTAQSQGGPPQLTCSPYEEMESEVSNQITQHFRELAKRAALALSHLDPWGHHHSSDIWRWLETEKRAEAPSIGHEAGATVVLGICSTEDPRSNHLQGTHWSFYLLHPLLEQKMLLFNTG